MRNYFAVALFAVFILTACGTAPKHKVETPNQSAPNKGAYLEGDGIGADAPKDLEAIPDAKPVKEPLHRYANRPYVALGIPYTPRTRPGDFRQRGIASWYGKKFHGQPTSSGEKYDMYAMTAAHPTLPIPSYARVTNLANQKSVLVRINDRGPFLHGRVIDLSYTAAHKLDMVASGSAEVEVESLNPDVVITPIAVGEPVQSMPLEGVAPPVVVPTETTAAPQTAENSSYLQLGAFKTQANAEAYLAIMRNELGDTGKKFKLINKDGLTRVHIGPYVNQAEARSNAESLEGKLGFKPMVVLP